MATGTSLNRNHGSSYQNIHHSAAITSPILTRRKNNSVSGFHWGLQNRLMSQSDQQLHSGNDFNHQFNEMNTENGRNPRTQESSPDREREEDVIFSDYDQEGRRTRPLTTIGSPLTKHTSYFGVMAGEKAEYTLSKSKGPSFLIRFSRSKNTHVLSIKTDMNTYKHYALTEENQQYRLVDESFPTIDALLEHYQHTPIDPAKPNTCLGRPCQNKPRMKSVEEPTQSAMVMQMLMEQNGDLRERLLRQELREQNLTQILLRQQEMQERFLLLQTQLMQQQLQRQTTPQNLQLPQSQGQLQPQNQQLQQPQGQVQPQNQQQQQPRGQSPPQNQQQQQPRGQPPPQQQPQGQPPQQQNKKCVLL